MDEKTGAGAAVDATIAAFYRGEGGSDAIPPDGRLVEALRKAYIEAYAKNTGGALDAVAGALADSMGRDPSEGELADAAIALAGRQAEDDAGLISRMFPGQAASMAQEYAPVLARTFEMERAASIGQRKLSGYGGENRKPARRSM